MLHLTSLACLGEIQVLGSALGSWTVGKRTDATQSQLKHGQPQPIISQSQYVGWFCELVKKVMQVSSL